MQCGQFRKIGPLLVVWGPGHVVFRGKKTANHSLHRSNRLPVIASGTLVCYHGDHLITWCDRRRGGGQNAARARWSRQLGAERAKERRREVQRGRGRRAPRTSTAAAGGEGTGRVGAAASGELVIGGVGGEKGGECVYLRII